MSLTSGEMTPADIAAVTGNSGNGGNFGWGNDGAWWIIVLFLFAAMNNGGWGNGGFGGGGNSGSIPYILNNGVTADVQRGFDQQAVMSGIQNISTQLTNGFSDQAVSQCNQTTTLLQGQNTLGTSILNGKFDTVQAITNTGYTLNNTMMQNEMARQQCCCDNKLAIADLKSTVLTENCADREALSNGVRDIITNQTANTQRILDTLCQDKIDAKNERIAELQQQLTMADLRASQTAQTAQLLANNNAQTQALEQYLNPTPIPAYVVQNPNCCSPLQVTPVNNCGCNTGCGCSGM